jgi:hypothetical protein
MAIFKLENGRTRTTHFGAEGMSDYTKNRDKDRKQRYLQRHRRNENWSNPHRLGLCLGGYFGIKRQRRHLLVIIKEDLI